MAATAVALCDAANNCVLSRLTESSSYVVVLGILSSVFPFDAMILMNLLFDLCNNLRVSGSGILLATQLMTEEELTLIRGRGTRV